MADRLGISELTRMAYRGSVGAELPDPTVARRQRLAAGVTRRSAALAIGITEVSLWRWERGVTRPRSAAHEFAYRRLLKSFCKLAEAREPS
jgi:hypothetical protein